MSTHAVTVVAIKSVEPHPNADSLSLTEVDGWTSVIRTGDLNVGDLAVFVAPDYCVPIEHPAFSFLTKNSRYNLIYARVKAVRLRQVISYGLLIPLSKFPELVGAQAGDNVMEALGIVRYEPSMPKRAGLGGDAIAHAELPSTMFSMTNKFDLENLKHYRDIFTPGEAVVVTEKIHGANGRFACIDGVLYAGSRSQWLKEVPDKPCAWWKALRENPALIEMLQDNPRVIFYGEVYGRVQSLRYGFPEAYKIVIFAAFDTDHGHWFATTPLLNLCAAWKVDHVPIVAEMGYDFDAIKAFAEEPSRLAARAGVTQISEGVVVSPRNERQDRSIGRVSLKLISDAYWLSNND